jgi:tetratricopeptide (TPR) repeat protein
VQARDTGLTRAARRDLSAALAAIPGREQWVRSAHEASVFLADTGLHEDACTLNRQLAGHLEAVGGTEAQTTLVSVLVNLGNAEVGLGRHQAALATFTRAGNLVAGQRSPTAANVAYNTAVTLAELNQIEAARAAYEDALRIWEETGSTASDRGYAVRGLAACLARTGRSEEALAQFDEAVRLFREAGEPSEVDLTQVGIMQARQRRGDHFSDAEIGELLTTAQRLPPAHRASLLHNIGNLQTNQRDLEAAAATLVGLRDWAAEIGDQASAAKATASLAVTERHRGRLDSAISLNRDAHARFAQLGMTDGVAHAEHNYALLLSETADITRDPAEVASLRDRAASRAIAALTAFDRHRHSLPTATDRHRLFLEVYGQALPATLRICMNAGRQADLVAVVERARVQPVLRASGGGFIEPAPVAACRGAQPVGGSGEPVVLGELAESILGDDAMWLGWWTDGRRLVRAWSTATSADADQGPLDRDALSRYAASLPIIDQPDLEAAAGDRRVAATIATWRAASGPMLAAPETAARATRVLDQAIRRAVLADDGVREALEWPADRLLWPLTEMLLSPEVRTRVLDAHAAGHRARLVVAPVPSLGRIPWAALPLTDPRGGTPLVLIEAADIAVGLPASLAGRFGSPGSGDRGRGTVIIADPLGDLESARSLSSPGAQVLGAASLEPATRHYLLHALARHPRLLAIAGHVRAGTAADPAAAGLLLDSDTGAADPVTVAELSALTVPPWCLVLGCDGSGASTGGEWTGVLTGLAWAGANEIATSTVPVIDDDTTASLDRELLRYVESAGPLHGLLSWQRAACARDRLPRSSPSAPAAPYRWATYVATRSVRAGQS